jgi:3-deoxy-D-manno-octulosonate 8-phosphate phosphatase (KDO 8-P phosphatase)
MKTLIVIPARLASTRLPEKALVPLEGKPLVQHAWEAATKVRGVDGVIVAADDVRIVETARAFGAEAVLTSKTHATGTDRLAEIARAHVADLYVNLQCDEPLVRPSDIEKLASEMKRDESAPCGTLFHRIDAAEAQRPSVVKIVVGARGQALYFSRAPIPFARHGEHAEYKKHVGIYAYRRELVARFAEIASPMEERAESLEQLRLLHAGVAIRAFEIEPTAPGVDTPEDLERVRRILRGEPSASPARTIRLVVTDVDGVLTDGGLHYDATGESSKRFHVRDGLAVKLLHEAGIKVAAISGRPSKAAAVRLEELGFDAVLLGEADKRAALERVCARLDVAPRDAAFIGDDLNDVAAFAACGTSFAPADADAIVRAAAGQVLASRGGEGAFREVADMILRARGA